MIAIVIPFYKIHFFEFTLQSLANQTDKKFNVYIGNDASEDNPVEIINKYKSQFNIDYFRFDDNLGSHSLAHHWQRCVALAIEEEWVMVLCDDDVLENNCIKQFYHHLQEINENKIDVVRFATDLIDSNGTPFNKVVTHPKIEKSVDFFMRRLSGGTRNSLSENIFKREIVLQEKFKNFPLAWHSDDLALLEFSKFGFLFTINEAKTYFRLSDLNITNQSHNVVIKNRATSDFLYYILSKYSSKFTSLQQEVLRTKIEKRILGDKKNIKNWLLLVYLYSRKTAYKELFELIKKIPFSIRK